MVIFICLLRLFFLTTWIMLDLEPLSLEVLELFHRLIFIDLISQQLI
jgi:hypothetical protein